MIDSVQVDPKLSNDDEALTIIVMITEDMYNVFQKSSKQSLRNVAEGKMKEMFKKSREQYPNKEIIFKLSMVEIFDYEPVKYKGKAIIDYNGEMNLWAVIIPICRITEGGVNETITTWL